MKAIVLAGGRGSRLGGLTVHRSKVMLPLAGRPMLDWLMGELQEAGVEHATVVHRYAGERILTHFGDGSRFGLPISYVRQRQENGTAGALLAGLQSLPADDEAVLVINGDNLVQAASLVELMRQSAPALLVSEHHDPTQYGVVNLRGDQVTALVEKPSEHEVSGRVVSTGTWLFPTSLGAPLEAAVISGITGLSEVMASAVSEGGRITAVRTTEWWDVDHPWDLLQVNARLLSNLKGHISDQAEVHPSAVLEGPAHVGAGSRVAPGAVIQGPVHIGEGCDIGPNCVITGSTAIGSGSRIGPFVRLRSSLLMEDVQLDSSCSVHHSVIGAASRLYDHVHIDAARTELRTEDGPAVVRRLGLVTGDGCELRQGVICAPGTVLHADVHVHRRTRIAGHHQRGARIYPGTEV